MQCKKSGESVQKKIFVVVLNYTTELHFLLPTIYVETDVFAPTHFISFYIICMIYVAVSE